MSAYVIDVETTGQSEPVRIVQTAVAEVKNIEDISDMIDVSTKLWDPKKGIEAGAWVVHGISYDDVEGRPSWDKFSLGPDTEYIIGHNVDYDWKAIGSPDVKRICTLALARKVWPDFDSHKLLAIVYVINKPLAKLMRNVAHQADVDVKLCISVLRVIVDELGIKSMDELYQASEAARIPDVMPFGKHKGTLIKEVPADYKAWLLRQADVDPYLRKAILDDMHKERLASAEAQEEGSIGAWWDPAGRK